MKSANGKSLHVSVKEDGEDKPDSAGDDELRLQRDAVKREIENEGNNAGEYGHDRIRRDGGHQKIALGAAFKNDSALGTTMVFAEERFVNAPPSTSRADQANAVPQGLSDTTAPFDAVCRLSCQAEIPLSVLT